MVVGTDAIIIILVVASMITSLYGISRQEDQIFALRVNVLISILVAGVALYSIISENPFGGSVVLAGIVLLLYILYAVISLYYIKLYK